jgi:hypothetical protein
MPVIAMLWLGIGGAWLGCAGGAVGAYLPRVPVPAEAVADRRLS